MSHRDLTFQVRKVSGVKVLGVTVEVDGEVFKKLKRSQIKFKHSQVTKLVKLSALPTGTFVLSITAKATDGRSATVTHTYRHCATKPPAPARTLTVAVAGSGEGHVTGRGINCPGTCSASFPAGTTVTLTAAPASGSSFTGWSGGGCAGTGTCTVTMSAARSVTATFATTPALQQTLTVTLAGSGSGSVTGSGINCPGTCSASFPAGTTVTLTPTPASGSSFTGWSGGGCAGTGTCTVTMSAAESVTATFTTTGLADGGTLTSGTPVHGDVTTADALEYTFTAIAGQHLTLQISSPDVSPSGTSLQMQVYDSSGANDASGVPFSTSPTEIDFTPTATQAGTTTVVISPYNDGTTGSFTLTYAGDVTGTLTSGTAVNSALAYEGQHADYTFTAVAGQHVTLALTNPDVSPSGNSLQMQVYDSSGANDASGAAFSTSPTEIDFTPTATQAGTTTVVISPYNGGATGSFTLTYARDVTGSLTAGTPVDGALEYAGQHADYTFNAASGQSVTLTITNPGVSPSGDSLQMQVYDSSGANDAGGAAFSTSPTSITFTTTPAEAGATTVVISPYNFESTGSFTLTRS